MSEVILPGNIVSVSGVALRVDDGHVLIKFKWWREPIEIHRDLVEFKAKGKFKPPKKGALFFFGGFRFMHISLGPVGYRQVDGGIGELCTWDDTSDEILSTIEVQDYDVPAREDDEEPDL